MKEAILYEKLDEKKVICSLCAHRCTIEEGKRGICRVRENRDGKLYSLVYGRPCSLNEDPIEKKPLFHVLPGTSSLSISTVGCNLRCMHCQNYEISQYPREHNGDIYGTSVTPEEVVDAAVKKGCKTISYTYTEPTIFLEYALDCAKLAHKSGIKNVFVSNGFMTPESAEVIIPYLDGDNIDLKGNDDFYKRVCKARVEPVKDTIRLMKSSGVWVEVTTLIIPGYNDSKEVLQGIVDFIKTVDKSIPWHVTQFYPTHKITDRPRTPLETLRWARKMAIDKGLKYVYEGNVPGEGSENTYCPHCNELIIERFGFNIIKNSLTDGKCPKCKGLIDGIW